jgi:hypothetical protein
MATYIDLLIRRRDAIAAELAAINISKPDYSIDGESISHASNRASLMQELKMLEEMIAQGDGPAMVIHTSH